MNIEAGSTGQCCGGVGGARWLPRGRGGDKERARGAPLGPEAQFTEQMLITGCSLCEKLHTLLYFR